MAGILSGVDPLLEEEMIREMQAEEAQRQGLLSSAMPQAGPAPILAPQAGPTPQGNRRDAVGMARSASALPSLMPQEYKPKSILERFTGGKPDQALLALSAGLLKGAGDPRGNFFGALGEGLSGYGQAVDAERAQFGQDEQQRIQGLYQQTSLDQGQQRIDQSNREYEEGAELRKLNVEKIKQDLASGDWVHVGNGVMFNKRDGTTNKAAVQDVIDAERAMQAAQPTNLQNVGNIVDKDGNPLGQGVYDPQSGTTYIETPQGRVPAPVGSRQVTESLGAPGLLTGFQYNKLETEVQHHETGLRKLQDYFHSVGGMKVGLAKWADQAAANFKTLFNSGELTPSQLSAQLAQGQVQALLGANRLEVLGPGVLTETDAQRVMSYLGGDPASVLQNPEKVRGLLEKLMAEKQAAYELGITQLNRQAPYYAARMRQPQQFSLDGPVNQNSSLITPQDEDLITKWRTATPTP